MDSTFSYTLTSIFECLSRAVKHAQPTNILEFLSQYFSTLTKLQENKVRVDYAELAFQFQEQWEIDFLTARSNKMRPSPTKPLSSTTISSKPDGSVFRTQDVPSGSTDKETKQAKTSNILKGSQRERVKPIMSDIVVPTPAAPAPVQSQTPPPAPLPVSAPAPNTRFASVLYHQSIKIRCKDKHTSIKQ
uniref:RIIa domain-containing protein n=1 Tax=Cyprinodon variegatus TaxID=28743 RepID=A0A3Q2DTN0_CYPVA